jgi:protein O-GlcNAc transferase
MTLRKLALPIVALGLTLPSLAAAQEHKLPVLREQSRAAPQSAERSFALGHALRYAGRLEESVAELRRGASTREAWLSRATGRFALELARVHVDRDDATSALSACRGVPSAQKALGHVCRAEAFLKQNRASEALPELEQALGLEPASYDARVAKGRALALSGKLTDAAFVLEAAIAAEKSRAEGPRELARVRLQLGEREAALSLLRTARSLDVDDPLLAFELGEALGPVREGAEALRAAIAIRPGLAAAHTKLAVAALALGELDEADRSSAEALRLAPTSVDAHLARGQALLAKGDVEGALVEAQIVKSASSYSPAAERLIAEALAKKGDVDGATEAFLNVYGLDKNDPAPLVRGGRLCFETGRLTSARAFVEKATLSFPAHAAAWELLGDVEAWRGADAKARAAYEKALALPDLVDPAATRTKLVALRAP